MRRCTRGRQRRQPDAGPDEGCRKRAARFRSPFTSSGQLRGRCAETAGKADGRITISEEARDKIILACSECKNRNYFTTKNKRLHPERVEWKKYCPRCNKHQLHKETK